MLSVFPRGHNHKRHRKKEIAWGCLEEKIILGVIVYVATELIQLPEENIDGAMAVIGEPLYGPWNPVRPFMPPGS